MAKIIFQKIIFAIAIFFLSFQPVAKAFDIVATDAVTVSATVGGVIIANPTNPAGGVTIPSTAVIFSGRAYPNALVTLLKNGKEVLSVKADARANFSITLPEKVEGDILYSLYARDITQNKSLFLNFPVSVQNGYLTYLSGILFAPTINTDKAESVLSDYLTVNGYAIPSGEMEINIKGPADKKFILSSDKDGIYKITLPLGGLPKGEYVVSINYKNDSRISKLIKLKIANANIFNVQSVSAIPGDCNTDGIINLTDFSVLAFWYGKNNPPKCVDTNSDGIINLTDFSILAFYWTG